MKCILYERADGGLSVVRPIYSNKSEAESEEEFLARIAKKDVQENAGNVRIVDANEIPKDRTFRNAWTIGLNVDMQKARQIHRGKMRDARAPLLADLDVEFMRAIESGDSVKQAEIAVKKQSLRDVTAEPAIEEAKTQDALKRVWPVCLKG